MRVSVLPIDSGYKNYREYRGCKVLLDGQVIERVFTADDELGEVVRAAMNGDGQPYILDDEIATETLYGKVEIVRP